jgi:hypothetical protein
VYSGEYDVCDVTLSVYPHRASSKNMPGHGGSKGCGFDSHRGRAYFSSSPVWIYTQSNITNIIGPMLTIVEYHKARPHERSSYWSIIYSWCILSYISHVRCSHLSSLLFFQSSYKFDPELFLNSESQLKFLERKNGEDS